MLPLAPVFMGELNIGPAEFSILASSYNFSAGIVGFFYSALADKYNRRNLLTFLVIGLAISTTLCGMATSYSFLLTARVIAGMFGGIVNPVVYAIIADIIPEQRRGKAVGTIMTSFSLTSILGIPVGLAIADYTSWRYSFYLIALGSLIMAVIQFMILPSLPVLHGKSDFKQNFKRLIEIIFTKKHQLPFAVIICFTFAGFMVFPFLSAYVVNNIGLPQTDLKYIYLIGGLFTVFGNRLVGISTDRFGELKTFIPPALLSVPFILLYTSATDLEFSYLIVISTFFMIFINARFVPVMTLVTKHPTPEERGSFMGVLLSYRSFAASLAIAASGLIITELPNGKLANFDKIGHISIILTLLGSILFTHLYKKAKA